MKIIKPPKKYDMNEYYKEEAIKESKYCPFCCETYEIHYDLDSKVTTGIMGIEISYECNDSIFKRFYKRWIHCKCRKCGAEWDTKPWFPKIDYNKKEKYNGTKY